MQTFRRVYQDFGLRNSYAVCVASIPVLPPKDLEPDLLTDALLSLQLAMCTPNFSHWPWALPLQHHFQSPDPHLTPSSKTPKLEPPVLSLMVD